MLPIKGSDMLSFMRDTTPEYLPELTSQLYSAAGDGMHVEVVGQPGDAHMPFMTFRADESLGLQVVLYGLKTDIAFPLSELKRVIEIAEKEARPESSFD